MNLADVSDVHRMALDLDPVQEMVRQQNERNREAQQLERLREERVARTLELFERPVGPPVGREGCGRPAKRAPAGQSRNGLTESSVCRSVHRCFEARKKLEDKQEMLNAYQVWQADATCSAIARNMWRGRKRSGLKKSRRTGG